MNRAEWLREMRLLALVLCCVSPLEAQTVDGKLVDASERAVEGALVTLIDSSGSPVRDVVSVDSGAFSVDAHHPGTHTLRIDRIGYAPYTTGPFLLLSTDASETLAITVTSPRSFLESLKPEVANPCISRPDSIPSFSLLWNEVRNNFRLMMLAAEARPERVDGIQYTRELDADGQTQLVVSHKEEFSSLKIPFPAPPPELGTSDLFGVMQGAAIAMYYAPTAAGLLSDSFMQRHCFTRIVVDRGAAPLIGLGFKPVRPADQVGISGTIWVDAKASALRSIEFTYSDPSSATPPGAGGLVEYRVATAGVPRIVRWRLRVPQVRTFTRHGGLQELRTIIEHGALIFGSGRVAIADPDSLLARLGGAYQLDPILVEGTAEVRRAEHRTVGARPSNVLSADEIRFGAQTNALDLIQLARPHWLRLRGGQRLSGEPTPVVIYFDGMRMTSNTAPEPAEEVLRRISTASVGSVQFLDPIEGPMYYGLGHDNGVIVITSRSR